MDFEKDFEKLGERHPGMWRASPNLDRLCIYRVPSVIRDVTPDAYTPHMIIIGPLHRSLIAKSLKDMSGSSISLNYLNTEQVKKTYLTEFTTKLHNVHMKLDTLQKIIKEDENLIRDSYSECTTWIKSEDFVDMVLKDSVFILMFLLKMAIRRLEPIIKSGDPLTDFHCLETTVKRDLLLLENQLPFFILDKLFSAIVPVLLPTYTLNDLVMHLYFNFQRKVVYQENYLHFTDLMRSVRVVKLPPPGRRIQRVMPHIPCADRLYNGGVKFEAVGNVGDICSLQVEFENGCLKIPRFYVDNSYEVTLRNLVALEQCHYPYEAHISSYLTFIDYLIDSEKDIELLAGNGIIMNWTGKPSSVAKMVNKLCLGTSVSTSSCYSVIVDRVNAHYSDPVNKNCSVLRRVYFENMFRGTATVAAVFLLLLTLIQTVTTVIQVIQNSKS